MGRNDGEGDKYLIYSIGKLRANELRKYFERGCAYAFIRIAS